MKTGFKTLLLAGATLLLAVTLTACGFHRHHDDPEKRLNWMVEEVSEELKLNDLQRSKLAVVKGELAAIATQLRNERESVHSTVDELLSQPTLDQARLTALITQKTTFINERTPALVTALAGFYDSLAPEQQARIREELKEHHGRRCRIWSHF